MECKADHSPKKGLKAIHNQMLNNDLTVVSCSFLTMCFTCSDAKSRDLEFLRLTDFE